MFGSTSVLISALALVLATKNEPYWWLIVSGGFEGLGVGLSFTPMQVSIQDGVEENLISVSTTWGLLVRTLGQTFMSAIFGAVLSLTTASQIKAPITNRMVNQLPDASTAKNLPQDLISQLRTILFNGIHVIMIIGLILVVLALVLNWRRPQVIKQPR